MLINRLRKYRVVFSAVVLLGAYAWPVSAAEVHLTVTGITQLTGKVRAALFEKASAFPNRITDSAQQKIVSVSTEEVFLSFSEVPPGTYAIATFHDVNDNGILDRNFAGMPLEPYGFSNHTHSTLGAPRFAQAAFTVAEENVKLEIEVR